MGKQLIRHWQAGLTLLLGLAVFLFWGYGYPFALAYQEQFQLFLFDGEYLTERLAEPGGLARYIGEFLTQFYNGMAIGAFILAVLFMLLQRLTWQLMKPAAGGWYALSFVPVALLWYALGDESVLLAYTVALLMAMGAVAGLRRIGAEHKLARRVAVVLAIPLLYWALGPLVLLVAVCVLPLSAVWALACMLLSVRVVPFPLSQVMLGIGYYRFPNILPYVLVLIPVVVAVLSYGARRLPRPGRWTVAVQAAAVAALLFGAQRWGFDDRKYELIEYDYLVRVKNWRGIIAKAEGHTPDLPMSVSATNLALAMTGQLGERAFDFYQRGSEGLLPPFDRQFTATQLTGEIYFHLGLVNTAQRFAFEAMEAIPNYSKSARVVKRLAETNLINGQYTVARKYLQMLEKTIYYRPWARRTTELLGNEARINAHPLYGTLRQYRLQQNFLFSDLELDKICGRLFIHNPQNIMAAQYLLMLPLLDRDLPRFMQYVQMVQNRASYNPRSCQEAIALAFMQQRRQPPRGLVSEPVLQRMNDFTRASSGGTEGLERFRNTVWYYLMAGK